VKVYFIVGRATTREQEMSLKTEIHGYEDVQMVDAPDDYSSLTEKTMGIFHFGYKNFSKYDFLVKVDDDTFVRLDRLVNLLSSIKALRAYIGHFHINAPRYLEGYKNNEIYYPEYVEYLLPFAGGSGYVLSMDLVEYIVKQDPYLMRFSNEDVSVGTWLFPVQLIRYHQENFIFRWNECPELGILIHSTTTFHMLQLYRNSLLTETCFCDSVTRK